MSKEFESNQSKRKFSNSKLFFIGLLLVPSLTLAQPGFDEGTDIDENEVEASIDTNVVTLAIIGGMLAFGYYRKVNIVKIK